MKNKERIEQLERQVEVLTNRVALLEIWKASQSPLGGTPAPAPMPVTWPSYPKYTPTIRPGFDPNIQPYTVTCGNTVH